MERDKDKRKTQGKEEEPAAVDQVEDRVDAEMKRIEGRAKEAVGQGMQDEDLEREGKELQEKGEQELTRQRHNS